MSGKDMAPRDFNRSSENPPYTYRRNPQHMYSFFILKRSDAEGMFGPIGEYTVLDLGEDPSLSEKKVMNLVTLMSGSGPVLNLGELTRSRLLYYRVPQPEDEAAEKRKTHIIFYALGERGVSKENALLVLDEEIDIIESFCAGSSDGGLVRDQKLYPAEKFALDKPPAAPGPKA